MDIDDLFHMLSWNSSEEMQKKGRAIAQQINISPYLYSQLKIKVFGKTVQRY